MADWYLEPERESWELPRERFNPFEPRDMQGRWAKVGAGFLTALSVAGSFTPEALATAAHDADLPSLAPPESVVNPVGQQAIPNLVDQPLTLVSDKSMKTLSKKPVAQMTDRELMRYLKKLRKNPWSTWHADMIRHVRVQLYLRGYTTDTKGNILPKGATGHRPADQLVVVPPGTLHKVHHRKPKA